MVFLSIWNFTVPVLILLICTKKIELSFCQKFTFCDERMDESHRFGMTQEWLNEIFLNGYSNGNCLVLMMFKKETILEVFKMSDC